MPRVQLVLPHGQRRIDRTTRTVRAVWRDTSALWHEFRVSVLVFVIAFFGGAALYLLLYMQTRGVPLTYGQSLYSMIQLMTLQGALQEPPPPEPQLLAFWFVMPVVSVYAIGRGVVDFVRLFFNRRERRSAWEEAVASTYRNHVIVLGVGHVGLRVIRTLAQIGTEVVAVDLSLNDETTAELSSLRVPYIQGDGRSPETLEKAGLARAQSLIVATSDDYLNLEMIMRARRLNPTVRVVVRMWDQDFADQLFAPFKDVEVLSSSDLSAPVFAGAALNIDMAHSIKVSNQEYSMIRLTIETGSPLDGQPVGKVQTEQTVDVVLLARGANMRVHPPNEAVMRAGDTVVLFARHDIAASIVRSNRKE